MKRVFAARSQRRDATKARSQMQRQAKAGSVALKNTPKTAGCESLLELDAGGLDHGAPALDLLAHERGRGRRRPTDRLRGQIRKPLDDVGLLQGFVDVGIDLGSDPLRRLRRR